MRRRQRKKWPRKPSRGFPFLCIPSSTQPNPTWHGFPSCRLRIWQEWCCPMVAVWGLDKLCVVVVEGYVGLMKSTDSLVQNLPSLNHPLNSKWHGFPPCRPTGWQEWCHPLLKAKQAVGDGRWGSIGLIENCLLCPLSSPHVILHPTQLSEVWIPTLYT